MNPRCGIADRVLVIAYGNPLRSDDGIAWQAVEEIRRKLPFLTIVCVHQLTPELSKDASGADTIIFIDAMSSGEPGKVQCQTVSADCTRVDLSHNLAPAQVLAFCKQLYEVEPRAFLISIGGKCFDHGERLSVAAENALPRVTAMVNELLNQIEIHAAK